MMKKLFLILVVVLFVGVFLIASIYITNCRSDADRVARKGRLFFLHNALTLIIPDRNKCKILMPPVTMEGKIGSPVSWREHIVNYYRKSNDDYKTDFSYLFRSPNDQDGDFASYVAVVDKRTLWDESIRNKILQVNIAFDKILLIEIPYKDIVWNSCQDYDLRTAMNLWDKIKKQKKVMYITIKGNFGFISDFKTKKEFQKMLVLNDEEILQLESNYSSSNRVP